MVRIGGRWQRRADQRRERVTRLMEDEERSDEQREAAESDRPSRDARDHKAEYANADAEARRTPPAACDLASAADRAEPCRAGHVAGS